MKRLAVILMLVCGCDKKASPPDQPPSPKPETGKTEGPKDPASQAIPKKVALEAGRTWGGGGRVTSDPVKSVAISPDGKRVLSAESNWDVTLWDVEGAARRRSWKREYRGMEAFGGGDRVAIHPEGKLGLWTGGGTVHLRDLESGENYAWWKAHEGAGENDNLWVTAIAFGRNGEFLASAAAIRTGMAEFKSSEIQVWQLQDKGKINNFTTIRGHKLEVWALAFVDSDGGRLLSASWDGTIRLWNVYSGEEQKSFGVEQSSWTWAAFSPDGTRALTPGGAFDQSIVLWDCDKGDKIKTWPSSAAGPAAFMPDGKRFVLVNGSTLELRDVDSGENRAAWKGHTDEITAIAVSTDGKRVVSGGKDHSVRVWDASTGAEISPLEGHTHVVRTLAFSPDGRRALTASDDNSAILWDADRGRAIGAWQAHGKVRDAFGSTTRGVLAVAFSPDAKRAVTSGDDDVLKLWDVEKGEVLGTWAGHNAPAAAFRPDGKEVLSAGSDSLLKRWDVATGKKVAAWSGHKSNVTGVAFAPDGKRAISTGLDQTVRVWDVESGKEILSWEAHEVGVTESALHPGGTILATASNKRDRQGDASSEVRLWDVASGKRIAEWTGHSQGVMGLAFSPDGRFLFAGSHRGSLLNTKGSLRVWHVESRSEAGSAEIYPLALAVSANLVLVATYNGEIQAFAWKAE